MLLALDTATRMASLALHDGQRLCYEATWQADRQHTVQLAARLATALEELGLPPERLSGVAVTIGPGSFTGLRVGLALAKGLAMARNLPLLGVPTLDVVAVAQGRDQRPLVAVLQAGRGRIFAATYRWQDGWQRRQGPELTTWEELAAGLERPALLCGEIDQAAREVLRQANAPVEIVLPALALRRAGFLAELGWQRLRHGQVDSPSTLVPLYGSATDGK
jgi:tRNA threonylcarbamoyladenosine biosynthesis protein TsaB